MKLDLTIQRKEPIEVGDLVVYDGRKGFIVGHNRNSRLVMPNDKISEAGKLFESFLFIPTGSMFVAETFISLDDVNEMCFLIAKSDELTLTREE